MSYSAKTSEEIDAFRDIVASTSTGAKSPQEVLEALTKFGIDWYVTEEGNLLIRYWQIGAEGLFSPEQAAEIRLTRQSPEQIYELDWLSRNLESIRQEYASQWVAIYENRIVAASSDLPNLMNQINQFDKPFVTFIPSDQIVWTFAYAC